MWRVCKSAGRPWPVICEDDVLDFMICEAVALKVRKEDEAAQKEAERNQWKKDQREKLKQDFR